MIALIIGVFFGTIFPALFIGGNDYDNGFDHGCQCERCLIKKLRDNPTMNHLKKSSKTSLMSSHDQLTCGLLCLKSQLFDISLQIMGYWWKPVHEYMVLKPGASITYALTGSFHCSSMQLKYDPIDLRILGIYKASDITKEDIKSAYFAKAKLLHPDSNSR